MSDEQADAIYGRLCREVSKLSREAALYEAELKRIGKAIEITGKQLQSLNLCADKEVFDRELGILWGTIEKYNQVVAECADKKAQRDKIDAKNEGS